MNLRAAAALLFFGFALTLPGCGGCDKKGAGGEGGGTTDKKPVFTLAWSEYPSWSVFDVASDLIKGAEGELGPIEQKWGVDVKLDKLSYEACIKAFAEGKCDAVCITNVDALEPAMSKKSVAVLPTSTSVGGDALIVVGIDVPDRKDPEWKEKMKAPLLKLRGDKVRGLAKSVSEYAFRRNLEYFGEDPANYKFENMDPEKAAEEMQTRKQDVSAIMVFNPMVLQTLKARKDARVLFDSSTIPEEIIDMIVISEASLKKPGGPEFACALIDTFYQFNLQLADKAKHDKLLEELGARFSKLDLADMEKAVKQTRFYGSADKGLELFTGDRFKKTMDGVSKFYVRNEFIKAAPTMGFGSAEDVQLRFDPSFMKMVKDKR